MNLDFGALFNVNLNDLFLYFCVIPCIITLIFYAIMIWQAVRFFRWASPNDKRLIKQFVAMKQEKPNANTRQLVGHFVQLQSIRSGVIGAVTSVGGFVLMPFGLWVDYLSTTRIHIATLHLIAYAYELENPGEVPKVLDMNEVLGIKKGGLFTLDLNAKTGQFALVQGQRFATYAAQQTALMLSQKTFSKFIPGLGLFVGFVVNYTLTRALMLAAVEWYSGNVGQYGDQLKAAREKVGGRSLSPALIESGKLLAGQVNAIRGALNRTNELK